MLNTENVWGLVVTMCNTCCIVYYFGSLKLIEQLTWASSLQPKYMQICMILYNSNSYYFMHINLVFCSHIHYLRLLWLYRCGKTTMCQLFASILSRKLYSINCHMHTEAADFLGGLRPARRRQDDRNDTDDVSDVSLYMACINSLSK